MNTTKPREITPDLDAESSAIRGHRGDEKRPMALVVDDDKVLRLTIGHFVEKLGFATRLCENGREAVDVMRTQSVDIVLLDAAMPEMDGFDACAAMRALPLGQRVPIIMITGFDDPASVDRAYEVGASEYVTKPVHWAVLRHRVHQLVAAARAEQTLRDDRAFLQSLVDAIPDPTLVCNAEGVVEWANKAALLACRICEAPVGETLRFRRDVRDADGGEATGESILQSLATTLITAGRSEQHLLAYEPADEPPLFAELHARPLRGAHGISRGMILRLQDVTERELEGRRLRSQVSQFDQLAHHDALTGLANRRLFQQRLDEAIGAARVANTIVAVLFLDLDGFKQINDTLGHEIGDLVLKTTALRLREQVRRTDTVARFGGDEFAIILRDCHDVAVARRIGADLLTAVAAPLSSGSSELSVRTSIGAALYPEHANAVAELLRLADKAMYAVKSAGKGALRFHGE